MAKNITNDFVYFMKYTKPPILKNLKKNIAIWARLAYNKSELNARWSGRQEYHERVCLASASDGALQSVEYRLRVGGLDTPCKKQIFY